MWGRRGDGIRSCTKPFTGTTNLACGHDIALAGVAQRARRHVDLRGSVRCRTICHSFRQIPPSLFCLLCGGTYLPAPRIGDSEIPSGLLPGSLAPLFRILGTSGWCSSSFSHPSTCRTSKTFLLTMSQDSSFGDFPGASVLVASVPDTVALAPTGLGKPNTASKRARIRSTTRAMLT